MAIEIERKFLVQDDSWRDCVYQSTPYYQGYLTEQKAATVRVRLAGEQAFLTIKGPRIGLGRLEHEYEIPVKDAEEMLALCTQRSVRKTRHLVTYEGLTWEIDEFADANAPLILAELELESESQQFVLPPWAGEDVSEDPRFTNSYLAVNPYASW